MDALIILDTNFLLGIYQFKIDIFSEIQRLCDFPFKLHIIDKTLDELNIIIKKERGRDKEAALIALQIISKLNIIHTNKEKSVDDLIIELVRNNKVNNYIVATQDRGLKQELKKNRIKLLIIKQKRYLSFD